MRRKNPEYMKEIIDFVDWFYPRYGRSPSCSEIAAHTTLKRTAVYNYLVAMNDNGMIEYNGQTILTPNTRAAQHGMRRIGIVGAVSCGLPADATVEMDEYEATLWHWRSSESDQCYDRLCEPHGSIPERPRWVLPLPSGLRQPSAQMLR